MYDWRDDAPRRDRDLARMDRTALLVLAGCDLATADSSSRGLLTHPGALKATKTAETGALDSGTRKGGQARGRELAESRAPPSERLTRIWLNIVVSRACGTSVARPRPGSTERPKADAYHPCPAPSDLPPALHLPRSWCASGERQSGSPSASAPGFPRSATTCSTSTFLGAGIVPSEDTAEAQHPSRSATPPPGRALPARRPVAPQRGSRALAPSPLTPP